MSSFRATFLLTEFSIFCISGLFFVAPLYYGLIMAIIYYLHVFILVLSLCFYPFFDNYFLLLSHEDESRQLIILEANMLLNYHMENKIFTFVYISSPLNILSLVVFICCECDRKIFCQFPNPKFPVCQISFELYANFPFLLK